MSALVSLMAALGALGAPEIAGVAPTPLPLAATAEVTGSGFEAGATSVKIGDTAQRVIEVEATRLRFLVALDTPLGAQTLTLTTGAGSVVTPVEVVPAAPQIQSVEPEVLVLGGLATVIGEGLATVNEVTLDGAACDVTEQTDNLLVFAVPFASELIGGATLVIRSPSGAAQDDVVITAPKPEIDALIPNPVKAGGLVKVRGRIVGSATTVAIAAVEVPVLSVTTGATVEGTEIVAWVPRTLAPKPYDVVVTSGSERSDPAGPLVVEAAPVDAPETSGVYPGRLAAGGDVWVVGVHMDGIERAIGGLALVGCDRRGCRLSSVGLPAGKVAGAVVGPSGAAVFDLEIADEAAIVPAVDNVEPSPATRGEKLVIHGRQLAGVRSVVLGGVAQSIDFVDVDRIEVTVAAATPLGAEPLFVAGNAGSEAMSVTVLDPLPVSEGLEAAAEDVGPVAEAEAIVTPRGDDGCAVGGGVAAWVLMAWAAFGLRARRGGKRKIV